MSNYDPSEFLTSMRTKAEPQIEMQPLEPEQMEIVQPHQYDQQELQSEQVQQQPQMEMEPQELKPIPMQTDAVEVQPEIPQVNTIVSPKKCFCLLLFFFY